MNAKRILGQIFLGICFSTAVFGAAGAVEEVATLSKIEGHAVASKGVRYIRAHEGMKLEEGDRLMVMEGARARLSALRMGCEYRLTDTEVLTIGPTSTCASDAVGSYRLDPYSGISRDPSVAAKGQDNPP